ncbi:MAG: insulinase family protein [Prevotella sp.]|nr:insulinase family protein [Prevotella sp.]
MKMKKFLSVALLMFAWAASMTAQMQMPAIPVDEAVRIGKLDNGLTYYIRHNEWPEHVANFYIAQRVGSIQEEESQRGLAHFLEHMAFNGSEHFKGNDLIEFTRSLGVEFGSDLNAYTSIDQTVYRVCNVPTARQSALDSCMLILKDWSNGLLLEQEEIVKERDVVHNEYRLGEGPSQRMITRALPKMYPGSKYGVRMPIGLMSVIDNFKRKELVKYYQKWYRPDNQAIIVVGDIDVDHFEQKVKELFSGIKVNPKAPKVVPEQVPDNEEAIYIFEKDKELQMNQLMVFMKHDATKPEEKVNMDYLIEVYVKNVVSNMFNARLQELTNDPDCPFLQGMGDDDNYLLASTKDAFQLVGVPKEGRDMETLTTLIREARRVAQFGFTATEYERAKADYLSSLEKQYTNRAKITNDQFGNDYRDHFLTNEPIPSIEVLYQTMSMLAPNIPVEVVNMALPEMITDSDKNLVVMEWAREADGLTYPTEDDMRAAVAKARAEELTAYVDNVKDEPLISEMPEKGSIVSETTDKLFGYKELKLSNGATVLLLPTDYKDDEVVLQGWASGGKSLYGEKDFNSLKIFDEAIGMSGLGNFSSTELQKALAGKNVNADLTLGDLRQYINAHSTPKDLETMFQMVYLYFTNVNKDEKQYQNLINTLDMALKNMSLSPDAVYSDSVTSTIYCHNPRYMTPHVEDLPSMDYDRILEIAKERYRNAGAFTFTIVGKFDEQEIRPFIEQYIAALPATGEPAEKGSSVMTLAKGEVKNHFTMKAESPKATAIEVWTADTKYTLENAVKIDAVGQILSMVYLKTIREDESAAYSCGAAGMLNMGTTTTPYLMLQAYCPMNPDKSEIALRLLHEGMENAAKQIDPDQVQKVKDYMLKQIDIDAKTNNYWVNAIDKMRTYGVDIYTNYKQTVEALTPESLSKFIRENLLTSGNHIEVVMLPEK